MTFLDKCDVEGESGSVTLASRRLKRTRKVNEFNAIQSARPNMERKCTEAVSHRTERAIAYLHRYGKEIRAEGVEEQQEIFETQMARLGDLDTEIGQWDNRFSYVERTGYSQWDTVTVSLASQCSLFGYKCRPRYQRHEG